MKTVEVGGPALVVTPLLALGKANKADVATDVSGHCKLVTPTDADGDEREELTDCSLIPAKERVSIFEETAVKAKNVGAAGTGGVRPFIYAKSLFFLGRKVERATTNVAEREFHSIVDYCPTSEKVDEASAGASTSTKVVKAIKGHTGTENNKLDVTKPTIEKVV